MRRLLSQRLQIPGGAEPGAPPDGSQQPLLTPEAPPGAAPPAGTAHGCAEGQHGVPDGEPLFEDVDKLRRAYESLEVAYVDACQRLAQLEEAVLAGAMDAARELCNAGGNGPPAEEPADAGPAESSHRRSRKHLTRTLYELASRGSSISRSDSTASLMQSGTPQAPGIAEETEGMGIVQFDSAVLFAQEGEDLPVNIMRLGGLHAGCSVDYETDESERGGGHTHEVLKGTVHFEPGERMKTITVRVFEDNRYTGSTMELGARLSNPQGCVLGNFLHQVRIKLVDNDTFPTNKFAKDIERDRSTKSWRRGNHIGMFVEFSKFLYRHTTQGSIKLVVAGQVSNAIHIFELFIMKIILNALDSDKYFLQPPLLCVTTLALFLVIPFGLTHLLAYQSKGWGVGGGARKILIEAMMGNFLNFREEERHKLHTYDWSEVFNVEVLTLVNDGYMQNFALIAAIGKVVFLALFMTHLAFKNLWETGETELFMTLIPILLMPPIMYLYLGIRSGGTEAARHEAVAASIRLRHFAGESVAHYRLIADYWSRPMVLAETLRLTQDFNKKLTARSKRKANDGAFFGWLVKLVEFFTITGLGALVIDGQIKIGTFAAALSGLISVAKEFQGAYRTLMTMQTCLPIMWKCVEYLNLPHDFFERKSRDTNVRRAFADHVRTEVLRSPGGIPEDRVPLLMQDVSFTYSADNSHLFCDLTATVNQGELLALIGPHNSGKSTFLKILSGMFLPSSGSIHVPPHLRVLHLQYEEQIWDRPLSDTLYFGWMAAHGKTRVEDLDEHTIEKGLDVCKQLDLHKGLFDRIECEVRSRTNPSIKGSEKLSDASYTRRTGLTTDSRNKLQLACALLAHPEVLIIHKPVAYASWKDGALMMSVLKRYVDRRGISVPDDQIPFQRPCTCIVSMEKPLFLDEVDRVWELNDGQIMERDPSHFASKTTLEMLTTPHLDQ